MGHSSSSKPTLPVFGRHWHQIYIPTPLAGTSKSQPAAQLSHSCSLDPKNFNNTYMGWLRRSIPYMECWGDGKNLHETFPKTGSMVTIDVPWCSSLSYPDSSYKMNPVRSTAPVQAQSHDCVRGQHQGHQLSLCPCVPRTTKTISRSASHQHSFGPASPGFHPAWIQCHPSRARMTSLQ